MAPTCLKMWRSVWEQAQEKSRPLWEFMLGPAAVSRLESNFVPNTDYVVQLQTKWWGYKQLPCSVGLRPLVRVSLIPGHQGRRGDGIPRLVEEKGTCTYLLYSSSPPTHSRTRIELWQPLMVHVQPWLPCIPTLCSPKEDQARIIRALYLTRFLIWGWGQSGFSLVPLGVANPLQVHRPWPPGLQSPFSPTTAALLQRELGFLSAPSPPCYWFHTCQGKVCVGPSWGQFWTALRLPG